MTDFTVWKTKQGNPILVSDMTIEHTFNTLNYLRRRLHRYRRSSADIAGFFGDIMEGHEDSYSLIISIEISLCKAWISVFEIQLEKLYGSTKNIKGPF